MTERTASRAMHRRAVNVMAKKSKRVKSSGGVEGAGVCRAARRLLHILNPTQR